MPDQGSDEVLALLARHAPGILPGATVDPESRDLLVPVAGGRVRLNLDPVLAEAGQAAPAARGEVVRRWLAGVAPEVAAMAGRLDAGSSAPVRPDDLRLQVVAGWTSDALAPLVSTPLGRTFDAVVVHPDAQGRPAYLTQAVADAQLGGAEAAVGLALQQTIAELAPALQVEDAELDGHPVRRLALPGYPFVPVVLVSLDRFVPGPARGGTAVLVPARDEVFLSAVDSRDDLDVVPVLSRLARDRHDASELPFSPEVFWYRDGTYHLVDADPQGRVAFPAELETVVRSLT